MKKTTLKSDLIKTIHEKKNHVPERIVILCFEKIVDLLTKTLAKGERVEIRNFGRFDLHHHKSYRAHNPKTGSSVIASAKRTVHFKPGKKLRGQVQSFFERIKKK